MQAESPRNVYPFIYQGSEDEDVRSARRFARTLHLADVQSEMDELPVGSENARARAGRPR